MSHAEAYARWVLDPANEIRTGRLIKLAAKRFLSDLEREDIYFDEDEANKMISFAQNKCCLWEDKWAGVPMDVRPWMMFIFQQIYGWMRTSDGLRRITKVYIQISKKNAKTTLSGIAANFHLLADFRINTPKVFVGANNHEQAGICVNITGKIIKESPELNKYTVGRKPILRMFNYGENIIRTVLNSKTRQGFIRPLSKEGSDNTSKTSGGKHGINPSLGILDEYGMSPDDNLLTTLESAQAARQEPLILVITTAAYNLEAPCYRKLRASGIGVLEGTMEDDSYLPFIFELDQPEGGATIEWLLKNEDVWEQSNPNIDVSVFRKFLRDELVKAKNDGGTKEVSVKTLNFNMWVDSPDVFISADKWNKNSHGMSVADLEGQECYGGIELVGGMMLNSFVLFFPESKAIRSLFWMPEDFKRNYDQYEKWIKEGYIKSFVGDVSDNDKVFEYLYGEISKYQMHSFAYKTNLAQNDIVQMLVKAGVVGNPISHGIQGISTPTTAWEDMIVKGEAEHFGNPVLSWMNSNCTAKRKEGDIRLEKSGSKIVGIYAGINALAQYMTINAGPSNEIGILYI